MQNKNIKKIKLKPYLSILNILKNNPQFKFVHESL